VKDSKSYQTSLLRAPAVESRELAHSSSGCSQFRHLAAFSILWPPFRVPARTVYMGDPDRALDSNLPLAIDPLEEYKLFRSFKREPTVCQVGSCANCDR